MAAVLRVQVARTIQLGRIFVSPATVRSAFLILRVSLGLLFYPWRLKHGLELLNVVHWRAQEGHSETVGSLQLESEESREARRSSLPAFRKLAKRERTSRGRLWPFQRLNVVQKKRSLENSSLDG